MFVLILTILLVLIDQISKFLVVLNLKGQAPLIIKEGVLNFFYLENGGAAFGMLQGRKIFFTVITVAVVIVLLRVLMRDYKNSPLVLKFIISLILGGTIGNFIDRIRLQYVVDFISVRIFGYDFAVFNIADTFIVVGTILLIIYIIINDK